MLKTIACMLPYTWGCPSGTCLQDVFLDHSTYAMPPSRFEAGTPAIGEAIGLGAATDFLSSLGMDQIHQYEQELGG